MAKKKEPKIRVGGYPAFELHCKALGLPVLTPEHLFHPTRKWRFDYAFLGHLIAVEIEGGVWTGGRHTQGSGFTKDREKYNEAAKLGWRIFKFSPTEANNGKAANYLSSVFNPI